MQPLAMTTSLGKKPQSPPKKEKEPPQMIAKAERTHRHSKERS